MDKSGNFFILSGLLSALNCVNCNPLPALEKEVAGTDKMVFLKEGSTCPSATIYRFAGSPPDVTCFGAMRSYIIASSVAVLLAICTFYSLKKTLITTHLEKFVHAEPENVFRLASDPKLMPDIHYSWWAPSIEEAVSWSATAWSSLTSAVCAGACKCTANSPYH